MSVKLPKLVLGCEDPQPVLSFRLDRVATADGLATRKGDGSWEWDL